MTTTFLAAVLAAVLAAAVPLSAALAQGTSPASLREAAATLARSGAATGDARAVLAAAQLMVLAERPSARVERVEREGVDAPRPEERGKDAPPAPNGDSAAGPAASDTALLRELAPLGGLTARGLLRLASRIAVEQKDTLSASMAARLAESRDVGVGNPALADELRRAAQAIEGTRGAASGPIWADGSIGTGRTAEFKVRFQGGRVRNRVDVSASNPRADLDCYLYDKGKLAAHDEGREGSCSVEWQQTQTGVLTLRVRNNGADTYFVLMSN
ncbi:MAG TPA: hypothetical protein VKA84_05975 [Gemmatimonadaceae bacterium]|nr:hypothetical protein [Gemmatimonadaceae bacterium]